MIIITSLCCYVHILSLYHYDYYHETRILLSLWDYDYIILKFLLLHHHHIITFYHHYDMYRVDITILMLWYYDYIVIVYFISHYLHILLNADILTYYYDNIICSTTVEHLQIYFCWKSLIRPVFTDVFEK